MSREFYFPNDFLFGAALSDYQHYGNSNCDLLPIRTANHYEFYQQDLKIAKDLNFNALRVSIEWSRIEPRKGFIDKNAINWYKKYLKKLKSYNIKIVATLHHFTNPIWFSKEGGWLNKDCMKRFLNYIDLVSKEFKDYIDYYVIINEPIIYASLAYLYKVIYPYETNIMKFLKCCKNMAEIIKESYSIIKENDKNSKVGIAHAFVIAVPYNKNNILESISAKIHNWFHFNYLNGLRNYLDFIGMNYYGVFVSNVKKKETTGCKVSPEMLFELCKYVYKKYRKRILITENGLANSNDFLKANYLVRHLEEISKLLKEGVKIDGYIWWSFLHGWEWNNFGDRSIGYKPNFSLVDVDMRTLKRRINEAAKVFSIITSTKKISSDIHEKYGNRIECYFESWPILTSFDWIEKFNILRFIFKNNK
ncbi:MAG: family 1 glycosylhydrolase [Candidatus Aenigmatarchaeota archaeon]